MLSQLVNNETLTSVTLETAGNDSVSLPQTSSQTEMCYWEDIKVKLSPDQLFSTGRTAARLLTVLKIEILMPMLICPKHAVENHFDLKTKLQ